MKVIDTIIARGTAKVCESIGDVLARMDDRAMELGDKEKHAKLMRKACKWYDKGDGILLAYCDKYDIPVRTW